MNQPIGIYIHVPFCQSKCNYCDFYSLDSADKTAYVHKIKEQLFLQGQTLNRTADTIYIGGGTPTLLPPEALAGMIGTAKSAFSFKKGEVTVEANPETVGPAELAQLRAAGVNRLSFGMQSAVPHVLRVLDREHQLNRPLDCVRWAREAGFEHVSLDLIYGTPGESDDDWRRSLTAAIEAGPDHVSAYALIVEEGTRLARKVARGEIAAPDDDAMADRYLIADDLLSAAGFTWYELSNWAMSGKSQSRHNLLYWTGGEWWGFGPGAHSHVGGVRWWNVKHPSAYAQRLAEGKSPAAARERLTAAERRMEEIMLRTRLAEGLPLSLLGGTALGQAERLVADALIDPAAQAAGRLVLTLQGRLLADAVIRDLT